MRKTFCRILVLFFVVSLIHLSGIKVEAEVNESSVLNKNIDINHDFVIDIRDLAEVAKNYNINKISAGWNSIYDFNSDGFTDIYDLALLSKYIGNKVTVSNISETVEKGQVYSLPIVVYGKLDCGKYVGIPITWNNTTVNTANVGRFSYTGSLANYNKAISLTLDIVAKNNDANINNYGFVAFDGTWVYYGNPINSNKLSKAMVDGNNVSKICDDSVAFINVLDDWIYYCNLSDSGTVYKIKKDGTGRTKLTTSSALYLRVFGGKLYYQNKDDQYKLYCMNIDGSNKVRITDDIPMDINLTDTNIYYSNFSNYGEVTKINIDGSSKKAINNEPSVYINVVGGNIFYQNDDDKHLYKINLDGSNKTILSNRNCVEVSVVGDWIYYIDESNPDSGILQRVKTDGSTIQSLSDISVTDINITGGRIFLYDKDGFLYSIKLDGSDLQTFGICKTIATINNLLEETGQRDYYELPKYVVTSLTDGSTWFAPALWNVKTVDTSTIGSYIIKGYVEGYSREVSLTVNVVERGSSNGNLAHGGRINEKNGWVYFADKQDNKLYKITQEGVSKTKLSDDIPKDINVVGNYLYYISSNDGKIYKMDTNGVGRVNLTNSETSEMNVVGGWIYYVNISDNYSLHKIKIDGTGDTKLVSDSVKNINVTGGWIYFTSSNDGDKLYRVAKDGSSKIKLLYENAIGSMFIEGDSIYALPLYATNYDKLDLIGETTSSFQSYEDLNVSNGRIYFTLTENSGVKNLYSTNLDGTDKKMLAVDVSSTFGVCNDWIYYSLLDNEANMYRCKGDNSGKEVFGVDMSISTIKDISVSVLVGENYSLPSQIYAATLGGATKLVDVKWTNTTVDTSKVGSFTYQGIVTNYSGSVRLNLNVVDKEIKGNLSGNLNNHGWAAAGEGWNYFWYYKIKSDGTSVSKYYNEILDDMNVVNDWIYYKQNTVSMSGFIFKVKTDGTENTRICDDIASGISVVGDWIYYINKSDNYSLYKIRTSGLNRMKLTNDSTGYFIVDNGWVYYLNNQDGNKLYKIKSDGTGKAKVLDEVVYNLDIADGFCYYLNSNGDVYKIDLNNLSKTFVIHTNTWGPLIVDQGWIYLEGNNNLSKVKTDGTSLTVLESNDVQWFNVCGGWVFYTTDSNTYYMIKTDGSSKQIIPRL